jgi:hypothetical protein
MYEYNNYPDYDSIIKAAYLDKDKAETDCAEYNRTNRHEHVVYYVTSVELWG